MPTKTESALKPAPLPKHGSISAGALQRAAALIAPPTVAEERRDPFGLPDMPPGVIPPRFAMDDANGALGWGAGQLASWGGVGGGAWSEGTAFLGYSYLALLTQRAEYRLISETIAREATRKWIKFKSASENKKSEAKIKWLEDAFDKFQVRAVFQHVSEYDGYMGRAHIYLDTGDGDDQKELLTPLGNGRDRISQRKISKGGLKRIAPVEAMWCYPNRYNANDPLKPDWYNPAQWFVMGKQVHRSRLLKFVARDVPDILKPAYAFGGLSLSQMAKPYIDDWLRNRTSASDMLRAFSVMVLHTDLQTSLQNDGDQLFRRVNLFNKLRDNRGLMMVNQGSEELTNVSAPIGGIEGLLAQSQEHIGAVSQIPMVKYAGLQPTGLNADSDGVIRTFYDTINAYQNKFFRPNLTVVMDFIQLSEFGAVDQDITFDFVPLWQLDEAGQAAVEKLKADIHEIYMTGGVVSGEEVRKSVAADPDSLYDGLDPDDLPDIADEPQGMEDPSNNLADRIGKSGAEQGGATSGV